MIDAYDVTLAGLLAVGLLLLVAVNPSLGGAACGGVAVVCVRYWLSKERG